MRKWKKLQRLGEKLKATVEAARATEGSVSEAEEFEARIASDVFCAELQPLLKELRQLVGMIRGIEATVDGPEYDTCTEEPCLTGYEADAVLLTCQTMRRRIAAMEKVLINADRLMTRLIGLVPARQQAQARKGLKVAPHAKG